MKVIRNNQAKVVDLGNKVIRKFIAPDNSMEINHMTIHSRHPEDVGHFVYETEVRFMIYVLKGSGDVITGEETVSVSVGDVVYFPPKTKFAIESDHMEYLAAETPAWFPEQAFIVDTNGKIIEETKR